MMPDPETIYAYDIIGTGCLYRLSGRYDTSIFPLGPDAVSLEVLWTPRGSIHTQLVERHFHVDCANNEFRLTPMKVAAANGKPVFDEFTLGNFSTNLLQASPEAIKQILQGFGTIAIAEHITRSRLEVWRTTAINGQPDQDIDALWDSYLEAETAITWSYPSIDWAFLVNEEQASAMRAGF
tara:strand:- start:3858 stop:4400 length:543 start_codon:yes stop_codon:yes gene_type:complete